MNTIILNDKTYTLSDELADRIKAELEAQEAKSKRWRAEEGEYYWYSHPLEIYKIEDDRDCMDQYLYDIGNYFQTEAEAEAYRDRLLAEQVIRDSSDFAPDWSDYGQKKVSVRFSHADNQLLFNSFNFVQHSALAFYRTKQEAEAAIADPKVRKAYLTVFGIKDAA